MKKLTPTALNRPSLAAYRAMRKNSLCILLDHVRSLHNVGSAFRTADAFKVEKLYLSGITGCPPHREIQKTALGATESVCWQYVDEATALVRILKEKGYCIIVVEQTSESIPLHHFEPVPTEKYCLIFGNEVTGISEDVLNLADMAIEIPQSGTKHSLNISVCLGIIAWDFYKKMEAGLCGKGPYKLNANG